MQRVANCDCGSLRAIASGHPEHVYVCHCLSCQRRTGAIFGSGAYFKRHQVRLEGSSKEFVRGASDGRKIRFYFCPICGSTVYYQTDKYPEHIGIAVGCFADPSFPAPAASVWESTKHDWACLPQKIEHFQEGSPVSTET
jgi:hypothetical protein